jgi:hypothetical protein
MPQRSCKNPANIKPIRKLTLRDLLYQIKLNNNMPLFLQLSQQSTREVNAIITNTPKAKLMAKRMNVQIAAWCFYYWKETNPGKDRFYRKLSDRAFNQVLLHEIKECTWDPSLNSLSAKSVLAREKTRSYELNFYVGIVHNILREMKTRRAKI